METDERISALERRIAEYDTLVGRLIAYARSTAKGRLFLKVLGL